MSHDAGPRTAGPTVAVDSRVVVEPRVESDPLVVARDLVKRYGDVVALGGVSFGIYDGITGLLGENGAGKSTAIKIFLGLLEPTSGSAIVMGEDASESPAVRGRLGYMPEHDCLPTGVSAAEFLTHMAEASGLPPSRARTRAADTLRHVGLFEERYRAIGGYSTGMKQRVKLAQALVHDPRMVFLDEPTAGLDPAARRQLHDIILDLRDRGRTIILTTHYIEEAEKLCERVVMLNRGEIVADGAPRELVGRSAGRSTIYLSVVGAFDPTPLLAVAAHEQAAANGEYRFATADPAAFVVALGEALRTQRVTLTDLHMRRPTLEDVYLELVDDPDLEPGAEPAGEAAVEAAP